MRLSLRFRKLPKPILAVLLIAAGIVGRLALVGAANVEPVLIVAMLAGALLGGVYAILVPVVTLAASDALIYAFAYETTYGPAAILGLALFMYTGYVFVALVGGFAFRRRLLWRTRTVAVFTAISVPLTVAYDVWTAFGEWVFIGSRVGLGLLEVYELQVPFTLIHIFSSLLFAPILGTAFFAIHEFGIAVPALSAPEAHEE